MSGETEPTPDGPAASPRRREHWGCAAAAAVAVQVGVLMLTFALGALGFFAMEIAWFVAVAQAAVGAGLICWLLVRSTRRALLFVPLVPLVSLGASLGIGAASATVAVACHRVLPAFEQVPPPPGVTVEPFASGGVGCMAETPVRRGGGEGDDPSRSNAPAGVFDHYRKEFPKHGWSLVPPGEGELRAERDGMYVVMYTAESRVYFTLGRCGEWGTRCLKESDG